MRLAYLAVQFFSSMLTTEDEYLDKASAAMDIDSKDLTVLQETIRPGLDGLSYDLKRKRRYPLQM